MEQQQAPQNQEQLGEWVRTQFQKANKHLAENGVLFESVVAEDSRYMAPFVAIWKINANNQKQYWVISGDLPVDYLPSSVAEDARSALRHFALKWQLKAENIRSEAANDATQTEYAQLLEARAEGLFELQSQDKLWASQS
ncbi:DUF4826 family protein [Alteromonas oceanisediminis]|uniref:DUF4826 family protein n=1 Tax=Alteromonas oceanisediminis TaxID=2836180 RepID=UPI001BDA40EF|nr:DUF4826 family protein [Alteromonas oceanisediminis]MBT0586586.1 DUF4826 family protein [Alteromonas oceanisediminis]